MQNLKDAVQGAEDGAEVGRAALPDAVDEDALLVETVGHGEAEVLVDVVLEQRHAVHLERHGQRSRSVERNSVEDPVSYMSIWTVWVQNVVSYPLPN